MKIKFFMRLLSVLGIFATPTIAEDKIPTAEEVKALQLSAEKGDAEAQYKLGYIYYYGLGIEADYDVAFMWYKKSAEQGNANGQYRLGRFYDIDEENEQIRRLAVKWYTKAAEQGLAEAQYELGIIYTNGILGVEKNPKTASKWFLKSANQGNATAQFTLANMYEYGDVGVKQNYQKAMQLYLQVAKQKNAHQNLDATAQHNIGAMYYNGDGVEQNILLAYAWFNTALMNDNKETLEILQQLEQEMTPEEIAKAKQINPLEQE